MRKASACKTTDGYMPAVEYDDGTMRIIDFTVFPDGVSAATRAKEIEDGGFAQAKSTAEGVIRRQVKDYAAAASDFRDAAPQPAPSVPLDGLNPTENPLVPVNPETSVRVTRIVIDPKTLDPVLPWLRKATFAILGLQVMLGALLGAILAGG